MKNYDLLFNTEYGESTKIDETIAEYYFQEDYDSLLKYLKKTGCRYLYTDNYIILYTISEFTTKDSNIAKIKIKLDNILQQEDVHEAKLELDEKIKLPKIIIKRDDCSIEVLPLSKYYPASLKSLPNLESKKRFTTCFESAYEIAKYLKEDNEIVSGHIYGYTDKSRYAHSWVETTLDGKEVVIDGIFNAIFNKEGYYALTSAKPLSRISRNNLKNDIKNYMEELTTEDNTIIPKELYYFFRDEIIKELSKNEKIFKKI